MSTLTLFAVTENKLHDFVLPDPFEVSSATTDKNVAIIAHRLWVKRFLFKHDMKKLKLNFVKTIFEYFFPNFSGMTFKISIMCKVRKRKCFDFLRSYVKVAPMRNFCQTVTPRYPLFPISILTTSNVEMLLSTVIKF